MTEATVSSARSYRAPRFKVKRGDFRMKGSVPLIRPTRAPDSRARGDSGSGAMFALSNRTILNMIAGEARWFPALASQPTPLSTRDADT